MLSLGRRRFLLGSGAVIFGTPAVARRRDYVDLRDAIGARPGPHTAIIAETFQKARREGLKVVARAGTYVLDDDLQIDWDGFVFEGEGEKTRFIQTMPRRGFLQWRGNLGQVRGFCLAFDFERQRVSGLWRGYNVFQRACAVWAEGSHNVIEAISGENTFGVVCLRGPVVPLAGSDRPGESRNFDYKGRAIGNRVIDISGRGTDFVLTGNQQEDLLIDGLTARDTTSKSVPPHAIYMQNPGSKSAFCGQSVGVTAKRLDSVGNSYSDAFKFSDIHRLTIDGASARDTAGGLMVSTSDGVTVRGLDWTYRGRGARTAIRVTRSASVRILGGRSIGQGGGILAYHASKGVEVEQFEITDEFEARGFNAPYRVLDTSEAQFVRCRRDRRGADRPMFVVGDNAMATIEDPECRHSAQLLRSGPEATVNLRVDPAQIDGWESAEKSILGPKDRIHNYVTSPPERPQIVSPPLSSAGESSCP